jgi:Flp pilus assembly protein TadG
MNRFRRRTGRRNNLGQVLPMLALLMTILPLFVGMGIDMGFAYVTKANLAKAADAAAMVAISNYTPDCPTNSNCTAAQLATAVFKTNYGTPSRDAKPVAIQPLVFTVYPNTDTITGSECLGICVSISATATIKTFFIGILPQWQTMSVSNTSQALRNPVIMTLVLDRTGSMNNDGGAAALPPAVTDFVNNFDENIDQVGMVSFAADQTVNVPMTGSGFQSAVQNAANALKGNFNGPTFSQGGLQTGLCVETGTTNDTTNYPCSLTAPTAPANTTPINAVVFFTDGWANMIKDTLSGCPTYPNTGEIGGFDPRVIDPSGSDNIAYFPLPPNNNHYSVITNSCPAATFPSQNPQNPSQMSLDCNNCAITWNGQPDNKWIQGNVTNEALYRSVQTANALRAAGVYVYAIGLGSAVNNTFLYQIANDCENPATSPGQWPAAPQTPDPGLPTTCNTATLQGNAAFAPDCPGTGTQCQDELNAAFDYIRRKILYRLSQ